MDPHLLIVDDDERIRSLLQQFLVKSDYLVSTAEDAEQARTLLSAIEFDLIILDVMMPGQDGISFTADPDRILEEYGYGRAHHRAVHFIHGSPGTTVNNLLNILGVTKQSLNRVLRTLVNDTLVEVKVGIRDRRERHLYLTNQGRELQERLSSAQSNRMRKAFKNAGPNAVSSFKTVLEAMMDPELNKIYSKLREKGK